MIKKIQKYKKSKTPRIKYYFFQQNKKNCAHINFVEEYGGWLVKIPPDPFYCILPPWGGGLITGRLADPKKLVFKTVDKAIKDIVTYFEYLESQK
ncbi:MAG: hypothetical protein JETCAE03_35950 [Ignavibacteriaceae bacterium]|jgi:hypothetical protein|nr:MAG: hypothetical protein JETCAE03_35950 [Ignavibacteriaceae bacterium]